MTSSTGPSELRKDFVAKLGDAAWDESWESVAKLSPELYEACTELIAVPRRKKHLSPKVQQFIALTVDSAATHLYAPGIKRHIDAALQEGATPAELIEVMELTATLGIHACSIGVPALWEVMDEMGIEKRKAGDVSDEERESLRASFIKNRGYINPNWEKLLSLSPEFFAAYLRLSSVPWMKDVDGNGKAGGVLEPKIKELIYCAFDASATHMYVSGLKTHMRNAFKYGATPEEIMEVFEIATQVGLHSANVTAPILAERLGSTGT